MMEAPRIMIAGTHSGVGKTTVTLGLMAALTERELSVQGYKVGPDYIDPSYHTAVTGRVSRNLDSWMLSTEAMTDIFLRANRDADISIIEGVMGFFDGKDPLSDAGSTAEISRLLACPVLLVIDVSGTARSAAAMVKGFQSLDPRTRIAGVIANRTGSVGHYQMVKAAVEDACGIPVVGYFNNQSEIQMPERHLGLIPAIERGDPIPLIKKLGAFATDTVDLDAVIGIAHDIPAVTAVSLLPTMERSSPRAVIAVARDAAFNFYYEENLDLLRRFGADLVEFSPLRGEPLPETADGLYIGGGFPEEFAAQLSNYQAARRGIRDSIRDGLPTYAECGGYMYLAETMTNRAGETFDMVGVIPAHVRMESTLSTLGYREVSGAAENWLLPDSETARGHEFHYSTISYHEDHAAAYRVFGSGNTTEEGFLSDCLVAGYTHLHFASNPGMAQRFVDACAAYRSRRSTKPTVNGGIEP